MNQKEIHVSIGEVKIGKGDSVLWTCLGSCVGIALFWKRKGTCALAHCLLDEAPSVSKQLSARFVSDAVLSLLILLKARNTQDFSEIEAIIVGGGNMTAPTESSQDSLVGELNVRAAEKHLRQKNITIVHRDTGGVHGRRFRINCATGEYQTILIPRIETRAS